MAIFPQSRYTQAALDRVPDSGGTYNLTLYRQVPFNSSAFSMYIWKDGDRVDLVANEYYGDPTLWWSIIDINPEVIDPTSIPPGTVMRIPMAPMSGLGTLLQ